jgi:hypothetical protein
MPRTRRHEQRGRAMGTCILCQEPTYLQQRTVVMAEGKIRGLVIHEACHTRVTR